MTKLDDIDIKIIELLQEAGNSSYSAMAREIKVSEATVRRRVSRLLEQDVIRVVAVADPFKLGFEVMAIIGVQVEKNQLKEVERALTEMPEVRFLGVTLGGYDLMLEAWFRSSQDFLHYVTEELAMIQGIQRTESYQIMRLSKYTYDWGKPSAATQALLVKNQYVTKDGIDHKKPASVERRE